MKHIYSLLCGTHSPDFDTHILEVTRVGRKEFGDIPLQAGIICLLLILLYFYWKIYLVHIVGMSVELENGELIYVKRIFVHTGPDLDNYCWLDGYKWDCTEASTAYLPFPLLSKSTEHVLRPCLWVRQTFVTSHCCVLTPSRTDFLASFVEGAYCRLCLLNSGNGICHNVLNTLYYRKPNWKPT